MLRAMGTIDNDTQPESLLPFSVLGWKECENPGGKIEDSSTFYFRWVRRVWSIGGEEPWRVSYFIIETEMQLLPWWSESLPLAMKRLQGTGLE